MQQQPPRDLFPYFLTFDDLEPWLDADGRIDWGRFFGNGHPVEIDVGCGRGMFLVHAGTEHPETDYLGIEIDYKEGRHGARRLQKRKLTNVRVLGGDVRVAFDKYVRPGSVAAVHVYFPDPWWKKKHRRRRVFTDQLVNQMARVLQPGGLVHSWTDVEEYFQVISDLLDHDRRFQTLPPPAEKPAEDDLDYRTSFERKKRQAGSVIHRGRWQLKTS